MRKILAVLLMTGPLLSFAAVDSQLTGVEREQEVENSGFICLSTDPADEVDMDSIQLASDQASSNPTVFVFDPKHYTWAAYRDGKLVKTGRASGGARHCSDLGRPCRTPLGKFKVYSLGSADCKSGTYPLPNGGAAMPHCMFFRGGYAIHGSPHVPLDNASHGCIRVNPVDSKWLRHNFMQIGTEVVVRPY